MLHNGPLKTKSPLVIYFVRTCGFEAWLLSKKIICILFLIICKYNMQVLISKVWMVSWFKFFLYPVKSVQNSHTCPPTPSHSNTLLRWQTMGCMSRCSNCSWCDIVAPDCGAFTRIISCPHAWVIRQRWITAAGLVTLRCHFNIIVFFLNDLLRCASVFFLAKFNLAASQMIITLFFKP